MKLTTLTVSTAFILIVATLLNVGELYSMAGMLAALPLVCYFIGRRQNRGLRAARRLETAGVPGQSLPVTLELKNHDSWPKRHLLAQDQLPRWLERDQDGRPLLVSLPASGTATVTYHLRPLKRGCYPIGPLEVTASDPLGIFHFRQELAGTDELLVYPLTVSLPWVFPPGGSPYGASSLHTAEMRGEGSEFFGIREYQPGDPLRRVHWRSSARTGRLAVVEYEHDVSVDLTVVLDARRGSEVGQGVETTLETAATVAASLARMVLGHGNPCRLVIPGVTAPAAGEPPSRDARGAEALHGIFETLARVRAEQAETPADALARLLPDLEPHSTLALITSTWDQASSRAAAAAVDAGMAVMVIYIDPDSFREDGSQGRRNEERGMRNEDHPVSTHSSFLVPHSSSTAEAIGAQIQALRAQPILLRRGADLAGQFAVAMA